MGEIEKSIQNEIGKRRLNILKGFSNFNGVDNPKKEDEENTETAEKDFSEDESSNSISKETSDDFHDIKKAEADNLEKARQTKYLKKYIENGKWVYVYENPLFHKNNSKADKLTNDINKLNRERERLLWQQDNDPMVEVSGGKIADEYGDKLGKIDSKMQKLVDERNKLLQTPKHITDKTNQVARAWEYPKQ